MQGGNQPPHSPSSHLRNGFTNAATAVTKLYRHPDHSKFVVAANAVTHMHRTAETEIARAQSRGARDALRECLDWVLGQGAWIDSAHLAQLLKHQIAANQARERSALTEESWANAGTFQDVEDHISAAAGVGLVGHEHAFLERRPEIAVPTVSTSWPGQSNVAAHQNLECISFAPLISPGRAGNSRKRKGDDMLSPISFQQEDLQVGAAHMQDQDFSGLWGSHLAKQRKSSDHQSGFLGIPTSQKWGGDLS